MLVLEKIIFHTKYKKKNHDINKKVQKKSLKKNPKDYAEFFSNINLTKKICLKP